MVKGKKQLDILKTELTNSDGEHNVCDNKSPPLISLLIKDYVGFEDGLLDGYGKVYYTDGHIYEGTFVNGQMDGKGSIIWNDGVKYEGDFCMNEITGIGKYTWANGNFYEGEVMGGVRNGNGKFTYSNGSFYIGDWVNGKKHGFGYFKDVDQSYEGMWTNDLPNGYGIRQYTNRDTYEGNFVCGIRHGKGKMNYKTLKQSYVGDWKFNHKTGKGTYTWYIENTNRLPSHNEYIGDLIDDKKHGDGTFYYADGAVFEGKFYNDKKHGKGQLTFKNGRYFEGNFIEDQLCHISLIPSDLVGEISEKVVSSKNPLPVVNSYIKNMDNPNQVISVYVNIPILKELAPSIFENFPSIVKIINLHLNFLRDVFQKYGGLSVDEERFVIYNYQFWQLMKDCTFDDVDYSVADLVFQLSVMSNTNITDPIEKILFETFISYIIILSQKIIKSHDPSICFKVLVESKMIPSAVKPHKGIIFQEQKITEKVFLHFERTYNIYKEHLIKNNRFCTWRDLLLLINDFRIFTNNCSCGDVLSLMTQIDSHLVDQFNHYSLERTLTFLEFLECLVSLSKVYMTDQMILNLLQNENNIDNEEQTNGEIDLKRFWTHHLNYFFVEIFYPRAEALSSIKLISRNL